MMILRKKESLNIISFLIALVICMQNPLWPFWYGGVGVLTGYISVFVIFIILIKRRKIVIRVKDLLVSLLLIIVFVFFPIYSGFRISNIFIILAFYVAANIHENEYIKSLDYLTKYLSLLILISLPAWLINLYIYDLPIVGELDLSEMKGSPYIYNNYVFFVTDSLRDYYRFYSAFDEPGVLGTLAAFILYGNRYDFSKRANIVILIGSLFTYSMAFYVLTILGWMYQSSRSLKKMLLPLLSIFGLALVLVTVLSEDQAFQQSVLDRFMDVGFDRVENRTGETVNAFWNKYIQSSDCIFGMGLSYIDDNFFDFGNSYRRFIIEYGLVGLLILVLMYIRLTRRWNKFTIAFFVLFFLSFLQRPLAFTAWQIFLYSSVIASVNCKISKVEN